MVVGLADWSRRVRTMNVGWHRLLRRADQVDTERLLADWRWLVSPDYQPFAMTLFGDWFFLAPDQSVQMLDLLSGELRQPYNS